MSNIVPGSWAEVKNQAAVLVRSRFLPQHVKTPEQAVAIIQKGKELGMAPMQSFASIYVINGKTGIFADAQLGLILKNCPGTTYDFGELSNDRCEITFNRPGFKPQTFSFSMDDAKAAGVTSNPTWKRYPRAMLRSRCISEAARSLFPDALVGASYTPEELGADIVSETISVEPDENPVLLDSGTVDQPPVVEGDEGAGKKNLEGEKRPDDSEVIMITPAQTKKLKTLLGKTSITDDQYRSELKDMYGVTSSKGLTKDQATKYIKQLQEFVDNAQKQIDEMAF